MALPSLKLRTIYTKQIVSVILRYIPKIGPKDERYETRDKKILIIKTLPSTIGLCSVVVAVII